MTPTDDSLPPSITPGSGGGRPSRRQRPIDAVNRRSRERAEAPGGEAGTQPADVAGGSPRRPASPSPTRSSASARQPQRHSVLGRQDGGESASSPPASERAAQQPPSVQPRRSAAPSQRGSHARAGSSAVPLEPGADGRSGAAGPERTRAMPARRGAYPVGTQGLQSPEEPVPGRPALEPEPSRSPRRPRPSWRRILRWTVIAIVVILALIAARVAWLWNDVSSQLHRIDALSGAADTPGETWLIVGSDARGGVIQDDTEGARADSVMLLHQAENGQTSLTSLPRDTFVDIPEYGENKINAAYSFGGPKLLVQTVEKLSGLTVDHYVEVGMTGVSQMVDAVGGVDVCLDYDVADEDSGLVWDTSQGQCQTVDGTKALAYSRMRKSDPTGDVGRGLRQRAVISAVVSKAASPTTAISFSRQDALVDAGTNALTVDESAGTMSIARMVLAFRSASGDGLTGAPPIEDTAYSPEDADIGETVLLQDTTAPDFFSRLRDGKLTAADFNQS
ncbi:LCP family protein [Actinomyces sp. oral taxon 170]|uniref:LCP family protein n=1 Tax=Actinomyces sp. oral taxon 170 TaxID=712117 RepID=UPI0002FEF840|nr:LCP family protein [Actinomyces sp. oral taxon 170]